MCCHGVIINSIIFVITIAIKFDIVPKLVQWIGRKHLRRTSLVYNRSHKINRKTISMAFMGLEFTALFESRFRILVEFSWLISFKQFVGINHNGTHLGMNVGSP